MQRMRSRPGWAIALVGVALIVIVNLVLMLWLFPEDEPQPLSAGNAELHRVDDGQATVYAYVRNEGAEPVELVAASVPGVDGAEVSVPNDGTYLHEVDSTKPLQDARIPADDSELLEITLPVRCPPRPTVDRLDVRFTVDGREARQLLRLQQPVKVDCA